MGQQDLHSRASHKRAKVVHSREIETRSAFQSLEDAQITVKTRAFYKADAPSSVKTYAFHGADAQVTVKTRTSHGADAQSDVKMHTNESAGPPQTRVRSPRPPGAKATWGTKREPWAYALTGKNTCECRLKGRTAHRSCNKAQNMQL